jgi:lactose/L-arabinose transport system substrate-binding protein
MSHKNILYQIAAVILLSVIILTACGPTATPATQPPATSAPGNTAVPPTSVPPTAVPKPSGKITVWGWKASMDLFTTTGLLDDFKAAYPDIQVEIVNYAPADVYQKLPLALQAGTGAPDVSMVESSHLAQIISLGGLADLTDLVQPYVSKINAYKWPDAMLDGKYYAMPWDSGPVVLYYRRDVFKAAGLPDDPDSVSAAVATWDGYLDVCKTIKTKTGSDCFSLNKANNYGRLYEMMLWQQGLGYYDANVKVTVDSADNIATLNEMKKFWDANVVSDQLEWTDAWYAELAKVTPADKPIATLVEASWMGNFLKSWIATGTAGKWGVALMPAMKAGQVRSANDGGSNFVIPEQSKNKAAAWAFVEFMLGREQSQLKLFAISDYIPSLETTYSDALFIEPDTFFAGQTTRQTYVNAVKIIPMAYVYGPYYSQMNGFVSTAIQKVATGSMTVDAALKEAADSIRQQTGLK